jgi:hypothetical protein
MALKSIQSFEIERINQGAYKKILPKSVSSYSGDSGGNGGIYFRHLRHFRQ